MILRNILAASVICFSISSYGQKIWTLQECVDYAVKNNLQVLQNTYSKKMQESNLTIAKKDYLPNVSGSISNTATFGQSQDVFGNTQRNDNFNNSANVGANVLIYNNGRLEKNIRKVQFDVEASQFDIETIQDNISLQIAQQYLSILLNKEIVKISQSALQNAQKLRDRAKITTDVGTTAQTILAEADAALAREKQNLKVAEVNRDRSRFALAQLLMLADYKSFDVADVPIMFDPSAPDLAVEQVLDKAYANQPQIKAAESRIKSSEAQTEVVKTAFWPTLTANAGLGSFYFNSLATNTVGINPDGTPIKERGFFQQYKDNFGQQVGVSANIPIFNKGITKLQVEQSKINQDIAKNNLEQQKLDVKQNVQKAAFDADANYETYLTAVEAEKSTKLALDFAEKSYDAGRTSIYDLNIARNNYANAQGNVAQSKFNYLFSQKLLDFYSGIPLSL
ncbi:TolC family protein [Chryseobacterium sp. POL2]|uniref:TolC family protein n=1 Tax=Chryseobacterium sp. POL2 TaxID=2713414 RepID=UPI0013E1F6C6|nr:TolC family protein [Chryseobacterium sp. POL2]QIG89271.1 TolC family protein [Chryseobacterium sp. POL2]